MLDERSGIDQASRRLADELAARLRVAKERHIVWVEVGLPDGGRADVFAIRPSWGKRDLRIYEVKASRSDFLRDVNDGKYRRYFPFCNRLYFAAPSGVIRRDEIPGDCGLITRNANGWRVVKPPRPREIETPSFDWMVAMLDRTWFSDVADVRRLRDRVVARENGELEAQTWRLGQDIGRRLRLADDPDRVEQASDRHRAALEVAERLLELARAVGLEPRYPDLRGTPGELDLGDVEEFLTEAAALARNAQLVDRLTNALSRVRWLDRTPAEVEAIVARAEAVVGDSVA